MGRPKKYKRVEDMEKAIEEYFMRCDTDELPYTVSGLALALGFDSRMSLINYCDYEDEEDKPFLDTIKRAKQKIEEYVETRLFVSGIATGVIFNLKNNFGWKDKQEIEQNGEMNNTITVKFSGDVEEWGK